MKYYIAFLGGMFPTVEIVTSREEADQLLQRKYTKEITEEEFKRDFLNIDYLIANID